MTREEINAALCALKCDYDVSNWSAFWEELPSGRLMASGVDTLVRTSIVVVSFEYRGYGYSVEGTDIALTVCEAWLLWKRKGQK